MVSWPVVGGKGETGKSTLTANLGASLSLFICKVILVDIDLGGAELHLLVDQNFPAWLWRSCDGSGLVAMAKRN